MANVQADFMEKRPWVIRMPANGHSAPNTILLANLGTKHDDTDAVKSALEALNFKVQIIDLTAKKRYDNTAGFTTMDFSQVAAVDLRDCRGWQQKFDFFSQQLEELQEKINATGRPIPVINPPDMFKWNASKEYLSDLEQEGVPVVKTTYMHRNDKLPDIFAMMDETPDKTIVMKPAKGSRATDVIFIKKIADDAFRVECPKVPESFKITFTKEMLLVYLLGYREKHIGSSDEPERPLLSLPIEFYKGNKSYRRYLMETQGQPAILIQPRLGTKEMPVTEISAVFIGDEIRCVDRKTGPGNPVAHEYFGGTNKASIAPDPRVLKLARQARAALPDDLHNTPYLRVDMLHDGVNPPVLLEIEAGSARLFLHETGRVQEYAQMIKSLVEEKRRYNARISRQEPKGFAGGI